MSVFEVHKSDDLSVEGKERPWLFLILAIAAVARIYISFFTSLPTMHRDSADYFKQAEAILQGDYINYFPNGYPLLIAITDWLPGKFTPNWMLWVNVLMAVATLYFVYRICKILFRNSWVALFAVTLLALLPTQINLVRWLTSEVAVTFFLALAYLLYLRKNFIFSGVCFAMAAFIRTEMLFIALLIIIYELIKYKQFNFRLTLAVIIPLLLVGFWCKQETGEFAISGHGRVNIMYAITASGSDIDWEYIDKHPEIQTEKQAVAAYFDHAKENPGQFAKQKAHNLWEMWGVPSSADGTRGTGSRILITLSNLFLIVFGLGGWWMNRKRGGVFVLVFPFIVITGLHMMMFSLQRYTFPVEPFLAITAAWMVMNVMAKFKSQGTKVKSL
ncbi:MAG: hypothetical protein EOO01_02935 [Chitinophagaceae bacterium]|nr:MAG: hypothetical protein EOO01_02935 [Chitinophagaceae bacterium]